MFYVVVVVVERPRTRFNANACIRRIHSWKISNIPPPPTLSPLLSHHTTHAQLRLQSPPTARRILCSYITNCPHYFSLHRVDDDDDDAYTHAHEPHARPSLPLNCTQRHRRANHVRHTECVFDLFWAAIVVSCVPTQYICKVYCARARIHEGNRRRGRESGGEIR